jgi:TPR repeat protein
MYLDVFCKINYGRQIFFQLSANTNTMMLRVASLLRNRAQQVSTLLGVSPLRGENATTHAVFGTAIGAAILTAAAAAAAAAIDDVDDVDRGSCQRLTKDAGALSSFSSLASTFTTTMTAATVAACDSKKEDASHGGEYSYDHYDPSLPYPEAEEFSQCLQFYRQQLSWYRREWSSKSPNPISANWPRNIPGEDEISALELDLKFCLRNPTSSCQNMQFRIASFYLQCNDPKLQYRGYKLVKELAERGDPDGMCLYGIVLNEGRVTGIDFNPEQAVVWWRRCVDVHGHIPSLYELAVAFYMGEGVPENPELAVLYFHKAATLHVGAAYMLGECLLDGVGVERRRAAALEWLIVAAELGHKGAQGRVLAILETQGPDYGEDLGVEEEGALFHSQQKEGNTNKNPKRNVKIERRFTIGGAKALDRRITKDGRSLTHRKIKERRKTIVQESREDGTNES